MTIPLKGYDKQGRKVLVMKPSDADSKRHPIEDRMKVRIWKRLQKLTTWQYESTRIENLKIDLIANDTQSQKNIAQVLLITNDVLMHFNQDLQAVVKGVVVISDNKGVDAALMKSLTPALAKKCIVIFQVVYLNKTMIWHTWIEMRLNPTWVYLESKGARRTPSSRAPKQAPTYINMP